jgi:tetratricopeptide (TPR) repeat protein
MGDRRSLALSYYNLSGVYADLGNFKKAEEYAEKAMMLYRSMGNVHYQAFTEVWLGLYKMRTMEFADAFKHIKSALDTANKTNHPKLKFMGTVALSKVHLKMGDCRKALETLSSLTPLTDEMKKDVDAYPEYLLVRYEALVKCGNFDEAKRVGEEIEEILKWNHDRYFLGVYMVTKAVHAVLEGRDGTEYFKIGISHIRKQGYIASYAEMQYEYGRVLHRMKKIDAEKHLKIAMQMFRDMNLPAMVADIKNMCGEC